MEELFIEFYRGKDEEDFLTRYKTKHGSLSEEEIDDLYGEIADSVDADLKSGNHELGKKYYFKEVLVGKTDYNAHYNLYIFEG